LFNFFPTSLGGRELEERLTSAQTAMMLQEESIKHSERERCQLVERISDVERTLAAADDDRRILQVTWLYRSIEPDTCIAWLNHWLLISILRMYLQPFYESV